MKGKGWKEQGKGLGEQSEEDGRIEGEGWKETRKGMEGQREEDGRIEGEGVWKG